jgi:hypothetical protein
VLTASSTGLPFLRNYSKLEREMREWKQIWKYILGACLSLLLVPAVALAAQSASTNYQVNEVFFGSGGSLNSCSTNYCSKQSAGETAVGNSASTNYQAQAGFNTDRQPYIQMDVNTSAINLGTLSPNTTATANASFTVEAYLAHGYVVTNASDPPSNSSYTMQALSVPTASQSGTEQFGINLVANTSPASFGANPTYQPDSSFSYGEVDSDYSNPNEYKYAKGDVVALSTRSTSQTTYTVSYIFNISNTTPGGTYTFNHVLVATATY